MDKVIKPYKKSPYGSKARGRYSSNRYIFRLDHRFGGYIFFLKTSKPSPVTKEIPGPSWGGDHCLDFGPDFFRMVPKTCYRLPGDSDSELCQQTEV